jgi:hypothetical protein
MAVPKYAIHEGYSNKRKNPMNIQASNYIDVEEKATELGLNIPTGLAILPRNFDTAEATDELIHESTAPTIRSLWRQEGVAETRLEKEGMKIPQGSRKSWEWVGPIIYISQSMLTNAAIPITINMISSYLYDLWKGHHHDAEVTVEFVVERTHNSKQGKTREYKRITFKGSPKEWEKFNADTLKEITEQSSK